MPPECTYNDGFKSHTPTPNAPPLPPTAARSANTTAKHRPTCLPSRQALPSPLHPTAARHPDHHPACCKTDSSNNRLPQKTGNAALFTAFTGNIASQTGHISAALRTRHHSCNALALATPAAPAGTPMNTAGCSSCVDSPTHLICAGRGAAALAAGVLGGGSLVALL